MTDKAMFGLAFAFGYGGWVAVLVLLALCAWGIFHYGRKAKWEEMRARPWYKRVVAQPRSSRVNGAECIGVGCACSVCGIDLDPTQRECPRCGTI